MQIEETKTASARTPVQVQDPWRQSKKEPERLWRKGFLAGLSVVRYDTIEEFNVDSKAEYTA